MDNLKKIDKALKQCDLFLLVSVVRGMEGGREGGREEGRERGREEGREGGREGGRERKRENDVKVPYRVIVFRYTCKQ